MNIKTIKEYFSASKQSAFFLQIKTIKNCTTFHCKAITIAVFYAVDTINYASSASV